MTGNLGRTRFSAVDATLGYLYQIRLALLLALRRSKYDPDFLVSIETLDDVTFEASGGNAADVLQTKHHRSRVASLTDASSNIWKTLRIWFEGSTSGEIPGSAKLCLVTTATAPKDSAASRLREGEGRDTAAAQRALDSVASSSSNKANVSAYKAYLGVPTEVRKAILERVVVIDASPTIEDLEDELGREVHWAAGREHHEAFLERLEGWWLRRVLRQLTGTLRDRIGSGEIEGQMSDLREQFKQDALPIDDDLLDFTLDETTRATHEDSTFVWQIRIIKAGKRRIAAAVRDYYRAFEQRSRWLREELIVSPDLYKYEKRLVEEWEVVFEAVRDDLGDTAMEIAKEAAGRSVLAWAEREVLPIRPAVTEPFVSRGSLHMLADEIRIGWHPEFRVHLSAILGIKEAVE